MKVRPITLREANAFVAVHHRHVGRSRGCRWCLSLWDGERLVAVAVVGNPKGPGQGKYTCEVTRLCSDGTPNACSMLYAACRRAAQAQGWERCITYILRSEPGASLRAAGGKKEADVIARSWSRPKRPRQDKHELVERERWSLFDDRDLASAVQ